MMKNLIAVLAATLALGGCSTTENSQLRAQIAGANIEYAKQKSIVAAMPVLNLKLPMPNCVAENPLHCILSIVVHAPQGSDNFQIALPEDPMFRVVDRAVGVLGTAAGLYLGGTAAVGLVGVTSAGISRALQSMPDPVIVPPAIPVIVQPATPVIVNPVVVRPEVVQPVVVNPVIVNPVLVAPVFGP